MKIVIICDAILLKTGFDHNEIAEDKTIFFI